MDHTDTIRRLYNILAKNDWLSEPDQKPGNLSYVLVKFLPDPQKQYECWLVESILTGLATDDRKVAYRCSLQAAEYSARLDNRGGSYLCDARRELWSRVEGFLS